MKKNYFLFLFAMVSCFSFSQVFITEIADPKNNANARYIELHNYGDTAVDFSEGNGWQINKYTNSSATVSLSLDLTGTIAPGGFYLIGYNFNPAEGFNVTYGFAPDLQDAVQNGVAGSNGDDDLALVNGADVIVDFFGIPATDNSNTCADYENGRAERLTSITSPSSTFNEAEWNIWSENAATGCTSHLTVIRNTPDSFDPGAWGTEFCDLTLEDPIAICDSFTTGTDTYTITIDFSGGATTTYTISSNFGTVDLTEGDPSVDATGTITVTGIFEGADAIITVQDGAACDLSSMVVAPTCVPALNLPIYETFTYPDGPLLGNSDWANQSGSFGDLLVSSGQAVIHHGSGSEDLVLPFIPATGNLYYAIDITVPDIGNPVGTAGMDFEYFAHFLSSSNDFLARVDVVPPNNSATGDYSLGIATGDSAADATWATDLAYGTTYSVIIKYDQTANIAELWVNAAAETDTSILGTTVSGGTQIINRFALRQSSSSENESILVDNLRIAQTFAEVLSNDDFTLEKGIKVYPNPTSLGFVNIIGINNDDTSVVIYDILGKEVKNETLTNNKLDVSDLKSGIYIIKITENNTSSTKKLVIR